MLSHWSLRPASRASCPERDLCEAFEAAAPYLMWKVSILAPSAFCVRWLGLSCRRGRGLAVAAVPYPCHRISTIRRLWPAICLLA